MKEYSLERRVSHFLLDHPVITASAVGIGSLFYPWSEPQLHTLFPSAAPAYFTYLGLSALNEHVLQKPYHSLSHSEHLFTKTKNFIFDHIRPFVFLGGALSAAHFYAMTKHSIIFNIDGIPFTKEEHALYNVLPVGMIATHLSLSVLKYNNLIKNSFQRLHENARGVAPRLWNSIFEHSYLFGVPYGVYSSLSEHTSERFTPFFRAMDIGCQSAFFTLLAAAAGGILHTDSLAHHAHTASSKIYRFLGKRDKAITAYTRTLALPTSRATTLERRLLLADLLLENGQEKEAVYEYQQAAALFSEPENGMLSSPDLLRKMLFTKTSLEHAFRPAASSMNDVVEYAPSSHAQKKFIFKRGADKNAVEHEFHLNKALTHIMAEETDGPFPPLSVACFSGVDGKTYHAMLRRNSRPLDEIIRELRPHIKQTSPAAREKCADLIAKATARMATLHAQVTSHMKQDENGFFLLYADDHGEHRVELPRRNYYHEFADRVMHKRSSDSEPRLGPAGYCKGLHPVVDAFVDAVEERLRILSSNSLSFIHGDTASRHFFEDGAIIDFERAAVGNPFVDLAQLYHSSYVYPPSFLPHYAATMNKRGYRIGEDSMEQMKAAWLHYAFCALGGSAGKIRRAHGKEEFYKRLELTLDIMDDFGLQDIKQKFAHAMEYSALKDSRIIDYKALMATLKKTS